MNNAEELLSIVDARIDDYFKRSRVICEYPATVIEIIDSQHVRVRLAGLDIEFKAPVRDGVEVSLDGSVFVKCAIGDFSNSIVSDKFIRG